MKILFIFIVASLLGCVNKSNQQANVCVSNKTLLDGVCVSHEIADYVACVRAQGASIKQNENSSISADVGYFAINAKAAKEVSEKLEKKYTASDESMLAIIRQCNRLSGLSNTSSDDSASHNQVPVIAAKGTWDVVVSRYTGKFIFTVTDDGVLKGVSHWSGGSGGYSNKLSGTIKGNEVNIIRYLDGRHVGKTQQWHGVINPVEKTVKGICQGTGCRNTRWHATIN